MPTVHLLRHAEPDWESMNRFAAPGPGADLVPLTPLGIAQAVEAAERLAGAGAGHIVASPMTRALQTATLIAARLRLPITVEFDLHEWLPHRGFEWRTLADAQRAYAEMIAGGGEHPPGAPRPWEPLSVVRARASAALRRHANGAPLIAVCHEIVIHSLTGHERTPHATARVLSLEP